MDYSGTDSYTVSLVVYWMCIDLLVVSEGVLTQWPEANAKNHTSVSLSCELKAPASKLPACISEQAGNLSATLSSPNSLPLSAQSLRSLPAPCRSSASTCSDTQSLSQRRSVVHSLPSGLQSFVCSCSANSLRVFRDLDLQLTWRNWVALSCRSAPERTTATASCCAT